MVIILPDLPQYDQFITWSETRANNFNIGKHYCNFKLISEPLGGKCFSQ